MSVQLTVEQEAELAQLAQFTHRSTDDLAQEAVARFLEGQEAHRSRIEKSREQIASGKTQAHEDVFAELKRTMGW